MYQTLIPIIAPVLICTALGYGWVRFGSFDTQFISRLTTNIGAPCLILSTFSQIEPGSFQLGNTVYYSLAVIVLTGVIGLLALKLSGADERALLNAIMFPNTGNLGLPLCLFAFGEKGVVYAMTFFMSAAFLHFTFGLIWLTRQSAFSHLKNNPVLYSIIIAMFILVGEIAVPKWATNTLQLLGGMAIPLMLLTLGVSLAQIKVSGIKKGLWLALARLGIGFAAGFIIVTVMDIEGVLRGVILIQASMPLAVFNYLFAERYQMEPSTIAAGVICSTLLSFATLPFLLLLALP